MGSSMSAQDSIARKASVIQMRSWNNMVVEFVELNTSGANLELEIDQLFLFGEVAK
jgi:transcriptional antiterminator Rof (Rho-off)